MNKAERQRRFVKLAMLQLLATGHSPAAVSEKLNSRKHKAPDGKEFTEAAVKALHADIQSKSKWSPPKP